MVSSCLFRTILLVLIISTLSNCVFSFNGYGSGTEADPYEITNINELQSMEDNFTAHYELVSDIDASNTKNWNNGKGFDPIDNQKGYFNGTLDGNGHTISNLYINRGYAVGMFNVTGQGSKLTNFYLKNVSISGSDVVGPVAATAGSSGSEISSIGVSGKVSGDSGVGGLAGLVSPTGTISDSYSTVNISAGAGVGGLTFENKGFVSSSYYSGKISAFNSYDPIILSNLGSISNLYWNKDLIGKNGMFGTGLTSAEMKNKNNFGGFDFQNTWEYAEGANSGYPVLQSFNLGGSGGSPSIAVSWTDNSNNEDGFKLYTNVSGSYKQIGNVGSNSNAFTHALPGQGVGKYVCYQVTAYNRLGESDPVTGCLTP